MDSFADLWGRLRTALPQGKVLNERAEVVKWFSEKLERNPKYVGVRLAHLTLDDLYTIQSIYKDRNRHKNKEAAIKYLWWATKTTNYDTTTKTSR